MEKILLIDGMNLVYRNFFRMPKLINKDGLKTAVLFGFLQSLNWLHQRVEPDKLLIIWEGRKNKRKELEATYKVARTINDDVRDLLEQLQGLQEALTKIGVPSISSEGYEADDIFAWVSKHRSNKDKSIIIASSDNDLYQLIRKNVVVLVKNNYYGIKQYKKEYGFSPKLHDVYKAIAGCSTDNVAGIKGFGDKKARQIIIEHENRDAIESYLDSINKYTEYEYALKLVRLPFGGKIKKVEIPDLAINRKTLVKVMYDNDIHKLNVKTFLQKKGGKFL